MFSEMRSREKKRTTKKKTQKPQDILFSDALKQERTLFKEEDKDKEEGEDKEQY